MSPVRGKSLFSDIDMKEYRGGGKEIVNVNREFVSLFFIVEARSC